MSRELTFLVFGLALGAIYTLLGVGLVLTYRMSRVLNLAHGALGMFVTFVFWQLAVDWGWPRWLAAAVTLCVVAPAVGVGVGVVLFRRLLAMPEPTKIAASVALLLVFNEVVLQLWGGSARTLPSLLPTSRLRLGDGYVGLDQLGVVAVAAVVAVVVGLILTKTRLGIEMRAVAEDREGAGSSGVDVFRVDATGWALSTVLAGAAGMLIAPFGTLERLSLTFLVVSAVAAAAMGQLIRLPGTIAGAALLGVIQVELSRLPSRMVTTFGTVSSAAPFLLLAGTLAVLLARRADIGSEDEGQAWRSTRGGSPAAASVRLSELVRLTARPRPIRRLVAWLAAAGGIALVGAGAGGTLLFSLTLVGVWTVVFSGVCLLNGQLGQVSLCHGAFMGLGALAGARLQTSCVQDSQTFQTLCDPLPASRVWLGAIAAGGLAGAVGMAIAAGTSRMRGVMLAITTLAFGFFLDNTVFVSFDISGGDFGLPVQRPWAFTSPRALWWLTACAAVAALLVLRNLARGTSGRAFRLIDRSPEGAAALGFQVWQYRLVGFGLSAALAGVGGFLYSVAVGHFSSRDFTSFLSLFIFVVVFAVGARHALSPLVAAAAYVFVPKWMSGWDAVSELSTLVFAFGALLSLGLQGGAFGWVVGRVRAGRAASGSRARRGAWERRPTPRPGDVGELLREGR